MSEPAGDTRPEAIRIEGLHKSFGKLEVLKGVSLMAREGAYYELYRAQMRQAELADSPSGPGDGESDQD